MILVQAASRELPVIATNSTGVLLMATPALSDGAMFERTTTSLSAIGKK